MQEIQQEMLDSQMDKSTVRLRGLFVPGYGCGGVDFSTVVCESVGRAC